MEENEKYGDNLYRYISGGMDGSEKADFESEYLNSDKDFGELKSFTSIYLQSGDIDTDKAWSNVSAKLAPRKRGRVFKLWYVVSAAAAAVAIAVTLALFLREPVRYKQITASTACENIVLPDGSTVCLNQGAVIEYQENFGGAERLVKFSGEGYFDIIHDESKPFVIHSGENTINVLGTEFNLVATDNNIKVSVTDGCVSLQNHVGNITVSKNEEASATENQKPQKNHISSNVLNWQSQLLDFKNCTLQKAVEKLSYVYGVEISIENPSLKDLKLTSRYQNAKIEDVMAGISKIYDIKAEMSEVTGVWIIQ